MQVLTPRAGRILDDLLKLAGSRKALDEAFDKASEESPEAPVELGRLVDIITELSSNAANGGDPAAAGAREPAGAAG